MRLRPTLHESPAGSLLLIAVLSVVRLSAALNAAVARLVMVQGLSALTAQRNAPSISRQSTSQGGINERASIEEKLMGRIGTLPARAVEEANLAYEFAPGSYTAGTLNAVLSAQDLVRELAIASGCHCD